MPTEDDTPDPAAEWAEPEETVADGAPAAVHDEVTRPRDLGPVIEEARLRGRDEGCRACYEEGQDDALVAVRVELAGEGASEARIEAFLAGARQRLTKL